MLAYRRRNLFVTLLLFTSSLSATASQHALITAIRYSPVLNITSSPYSQLINGSADLPFDDAIREYGKHISFESRKTQVKCDVTYQNGSLRIAEDWRNSYSVNYPGVVAWHLSTNGGKESLGSSEPTWLVFWKDFLDKCKETPQAIELIHLLDDANSAYRERLSELSNPNSKLSKANRRAIDLVAEERTRRYAEAEEQQKLSRIAASRAAEINIKNVALRTDRVKGYRDFKFGMTLETLQKLNLNCVKQILQVGLNQPGDTLYSTAFYGASRCYDILGAPRALLFNFGRDGTLNQVRVKMGAFDKGVYEKLLNGLIEKYGTPIFTANNIEINWFNAHRAGWIPLAAFEAYGIILSASYERSEGALYQTLTVSYGDDKVSERYKSHCETFRRQTPKPRPAPSLNREDL